MTKKEQILQTIYNILNSIKKSENFDLFRNKEIDYEFIDKQKLVNIKDGSYEVVDVILSPRIDTIEQTISLELYVQEQDGQDIHAQLDEFEEIVLNSIKSSDELSLLTWDLTINYHPNETLEPENGQQIKKAEIDIVVVFDDL